MKTILAGLVLSLLVVTSKAGDPEAIEHEDLEDEMKDPAEWKFDDEPRESTTLEMAMKMLVECLNQDGRMTKKCMRKFKRQVPDEMFKGAMDALRPCKNRPKNGQQYLGCLMKLKESLFDVEASASGENWI